MSKSALALFCLAVASQAVFGQEVTLAAEPASVVVETCKKKQAAQFEVRIKESFRVENKSRQTVLVPRGPLLVDGVRVAESANAAGEGRFLFVIEPDFFSAGDRAPSPPGLRDFVVLKSGESHEFTVERTLKGTMDPNVSNRYVLHSGRTYWIQFRFWTLPEYFDSKVFKQFRRKWKGTGTLLNQEVWTEPASFKLMLDDSQSCLALK